MLSQQAEGSRVRGHGAQGQFLSRRHMLAAEEQSLREYSVTPKANVEIMLAVVLGLLKLTH